MPTTEIFSGIAAMRTPDAPSAKAISSARFVTFESFTPRLQLELIPRDRRAARNVDDRRLDAEGLERIAEPLGVLAHFLGSVVRRAGALLQ